MADKKAAKKNEDQTEDPLLIRWGRWAVDGIWRDVPWSRTVVSDQIAELTHKSAIEALKARESIRLD